MGNLPGTQGHGGFGQVRGLFGGQHTAQYGGPGYPPPYNPGQGHYPPQGYPPQGYPPQGYPPQGYPGYPPGQMYPGPGYHGGPYQRPGSPGGAMGEAACCGSLIACLTCILCSCSPCIMGAGGGGMRSEDEAGEDGNEAPETANVSAPHDEENQ